MDYKIITPPFTLVFTEMSKSDLKKYFDWFLAQIPERITQLEDVVSSGRLGEKWVADQTPESLMQLSRWFERNVETRPRDKEEIKEIRGKTPYNFEVPDYDLTNQTFSIAMDLGMYLSQVVLKNIRGTRWEQPLAGKKFVDYGQPVIAGFGKVSMNPVRLVVTLAYSIASKDQDYGISELYQIWLRKSETGMPDVGH